MLSVLTAMTRLALSPVYQRADGAMKNRLAARLRSVRGQRIRLLRSQP